MPSAFSTNATYAFGGADQMSTWQFASSSCSLNAFGTYAAIRFADVADIMALTSLNAEITSATLTISGIGFPSTAESLSARIDITSGGHYPDPELPQDLAELFEMGISDPAAVDVQGLNVAVIDIRLILDTALGNQIEGGDVIIFRLNNPTYSGTSLLGMTARLDVAWDVLTPTEPEATIEDIDCTLTVESLTAITPPVATLVDVEAVLEIETLTAITPPVATLVDIEAVLEIETLSSTPEATITDIDADLTIETLTMTRSPVATLTDATATSSVETLAAVVPPIATLSDIDADLTASAIRRLNGWNQVDVKNWSLKVAGAA